MFQLATCGRPIDSILGAFAPSISFGAVGGVGSRTASSTWWYRPSNVTCSPASSRRTIVNASSNRETRWSKGSPKARNSTSFQPQPRPSTSLPPESSCVAAAIRASTPGGWKAVHATSGPRSMRSVIPASQASVVHASHGPRSGVAVQQMVADPERVEPAPPPQPAPSPRPRPGAPRTPPREAECRPSYGPERLERRAGRTGWRRSSARPRRAWSISSTWSMSSSRPSPAPLRAVDGDRMRVVAQAPTFSVERYVPPVRRRVSRKSSKIRVAALVHLRHRDGAVDRPDRIFGDHLKERARVAAAKGVEDAPDPVVSVQAVRASGRSPRAASDRARRARDGPTTRSPGRSCGSCSRAPCPWS